MVMVSLILQKQGLQAVMEKQAALMQMAMAGATPLMHSLH